MFNSKEYNINYNTLNDIIYRSEDLNKLKSTLSYIKIKKIKINKITSTYIELNFLECVLRQRIHSLGYCEIKESINMLTKALECVDEIREYSSKFDYKGPINELVITNEETLILCELALFNNPINSYNKAIAKFQFIRENNPDKQLYNLTLMNEARVRLNLAVNKVNSFENCIESIILSEKAIKGFTENDFRFKDILQNQANAITELELYNPYGFGIDNKRILEKFIDKIETDENSISKIRMSINLIKLGVKNPSELNILYKSIKKIRTELSKEEIAYHECIILEGETLILLSIFEKDKIESIGYLNKCIDHFKSYQRFNNYKDKYYENITKFKQGYAHFLLTKKNIHKKHNLNIALDLLIESKKYYEETPYQNNEIYYPETLMHLAIVKKEISLINNSLNTDYLEIENIFLKSIEYFKYRNNKEKIINIYLELGDLFFRLSHYKEAYYYLEKGVNLIEIMRNSIKNMKIRKKFFDRMNKIYELIILTCYYLNRKNDVLKFIELSKHRIFIDKISTRQKNKFYNVSSTLLNELKCIQSKITFIENKLYNLDKNNFKYSSNYIRLFKLNKHQEYYLSKLKEEYPKYYNYFYNNIIDYHEINLDNTTLIEYYYTNNLLIIILIEKDKFIMKKIDIEKNNLNKLIFELKSIINQNYKYNNYLKEFNQMLKELHKILFEPIKNEISNEKLLIIPYKELHNIPFYCLNDKEYLIDNYTISIIQSVSSIKFIKNNYSTEENNNYLIIGNPSCDLKYAKKEAINISKILKTTPILDDKATKSRIIKEFENKSIIHYAGHGLFIPENTSESYLKLNDKKLYLKDLEKIELNTKLMVLSACETGKVSVNPSDESEGFINCLQINGVKYIIASLWAINDLPTKKLFEIFYSMNDEYSKRLRLAELKLKEEFNILEWGAFQIYGI